MKKLSRFTMLLLATNVLTVSALMWGCGPKITKTHKGIEGAAGLPGCADNCYAAICDTTPPFPLDNATEMVRNYRNNHWMKINGNCPPFNMAMNAQAPGGMGTPSDTIIDSRAVWFDLDTLKKFIHTIETYSCYYTGTCKQLELGIRIYYAEYPCDTAKLRLNYNITDPRYAGMHTVLMVPTYNYGNMNIDFDPTQTQPDVSPCSGRSTFETTAHAPILALAPQITAKNHGGLAPPPYHCNDYWNTTGALFMRYVDNNGGSQGTCPPTGN